MTSTTFYQKYPEYLYQDCMSWMDFYNYMLSLSWVQDDEALKQSYQNEFNQHKVYDV
jgi:hypothetical protein